MTFLCSGKFKKTPVGVRIDFDVLSGKTLNNKFYIDWPDIQDKHFFSFEPFAAASDIRFLHDEITHLDFDCYPELEGDADGYHRLLRGGTMEIKLRNKREEDKARRQEILDFFTPESDHAYLCPIEAFNIDQGLPDHEFLGLEDMNDKEDDEPWTGYSYRKKDGSLSFLFGEAAK